MFVATLIRHARRLFLLHHCRWTAIQTCRVLGHVPKTLVTNLCDKVSVEIPSHDSLRVVTLSIGAGPLREDPLGTTFKGPYKQP